VIFHKNTRIVITFFLFSLTLSCSSPSLIEYVPKNQKEKSIIRILIQYEDAKNNYDLDRFFACLHERGLYNFAGGVMVSKEELRRLLPAFWFELKSNNPLIYPIGRESMSGNYIRTIRFFNPQIITNEDTANVTLTFIYLGWRRRHYVSMLRENDQWLITKLDWEQN